MKKHKNLVVMALLLLARAADAAVMLSDAFSLPDGLITNEYAYYNPGASGIKTSPTWQVSSGSLFAKSGAAWSGKPDSIGPNAGSTNGTHSAVFRAETKRADFKDVVVTMRLLNNGLSTALPAQSYDGVHVWLRYYSETQLYAVTLNRRDNVVVVKKKVPGGPSNGGTYYTLATAPYAVPYRTWQNIEASAVTQSDGSVAIKLLINGAQKLSVIDKGTGGAPLAQAGRVGVRGDNCDFQFDDFTVSSPGTQTAPTAMTFSAVTAANITTSGATIQWTTNLVSNSQVEYGPTTAYGAQTAPSTATGLYHSSALSGLKPGTLYHYRVKSNGVASADHTFTTAGASMAFTDVKTANLTSTGVTIQWTTNLVSNSQVEYGLTSAYGTQTPASTATGLYHSMALTGLQPGKTYYYRVKSGGAASQGYTFTTPGTATSGGMTFSAVKADSITRTGARVTWTTNAVSNSQVSYGTSSSLGSQTPASSATGLYHSMTLANLRPGTLYYYRPVSNGVTAPTGFTFRTPS